MGFEKCGALWLKDGKNGKFMAGEIQVNQQSIPVFIFKNDKGDNPKRPDYTIHRQAEDEYTPTEPEPTPQSFAPSDDDVPF